MKRICVPERYVNDVCTLPGVLIDSYHSPPMQGYVLCLHRRNVKAKVLCPGLLVEQHHRAAASVAASSGVSTFGFKVIHANSKYTNHPRSDNRMKEGWGRVDPDVLVLFICNQSPYFKEVLDSLYCIMCVVNMLRHISISKWVPWCSLSMASLNYSSISHRHTTLII